MKKLMLLLSVVTIGLTVTSCEKAAELLFQPFELPLNFNINIDPAPAGVNSSLGNSVINFNLDQEVRNNTGGAFGASFIKTITVTQLAIDLSNGDASNNLGNFETFSISFSDGTSTPVVLGPFPVPATAGNSITIPVTNSPNIRQFFNGNNVNFSVSGRLRTSTTKTLQATAKPTVRFDK